MLEITALIRPFCLEKFRSFLSEFSIPEVVISDPRHAGSMVTIPLNGVVNKELLSSPRLSVAFYMGMENSGRVLKKIITRTVNGEFGDSKMYLRTRDL